MKLSLKEQLLIIRTRKGDQEAFGKIYDLYVKKIYRFIFFKVPTTELAEDLTHETFIKLLSYIKTKEKQIDNLQAFIYGIARNVVADYYQKEHQNNLDTSELKSWQEIGDGTDDLAGDVNLPDELDKEIDLEKILVALEKITNNDYREIILLRYIEDLEFDEISALMNKNAATLRVLLHRALNELKKKIRS